MYSHIIIHYAEIATKGKNRPLFEKQLLQNSKQAIKDLPSTSIKRGYGRLIITLKKGPKLEAFSKALQKVFGISHFSFTLATSLSIEALKEAASTLLAQHKGSIAVKTRRPNKTFSTSSTEVNKILGAHLQEKFNCKVNLTTPDVTLFIEITEKQCFLYTEKIKGLGGLPVGVSANVISLLSGGIDSPVASYLLMKRGCPVTFVHCYNKTINKAASLEKVKALVKTLKQYQPRSKLYLVPFEKIQNEIIKTVPAKFRMITYRRMMFLIAESLASKEKAQALVTGESTGQVASQTLENMATIESIATLPILRPLIGFDKQEIITLAETIGTFQTSILPYEDCCSFMIAPHPATKTKPHFIEEVEKALNKPTLVTNAVKAAEVIQW